jgi:hypothetical protein
MVRWANVEGYDGRYRVSDYGDVLSIARDVVRVINGKQNITHYPERLLKQKLHKAGYFCVQLSKDSVGTEFFTHRLVAKAFVEGEGVLVRHLDGDPTNCHWKNLAWGSYKDNEADKRRHGRTPRGNSHHNAVLNSMLVRVIRRSLLTDLQLSRLLGIGRTAIYCARRGRTWGHI